MTDGPGQDRLPPPPPARRGLLDELRRRKVFRVAVVYGATAFAALQAADLVLPRLGVPDRAMSVIVVLVLLGFPVALVLGWALELTPDGVRVTPRSPAPHEPAPALLGRRTLLVAGALVLAGFAFGAGWIARPGTTDSSGAGVSVAVLPFADLSDDRSQEYLGDGIAEELLNTLRSADVAVASRTSSFAFKGRGLSAREIADALGVDHIIDGSVRKAGDRLRIGAQVIDVRSDRQVWAQTFDRGMDDIFSIQAEIAAAVASALRVRFGASDAPVPGTASTEAYDLYLLGLYHWNRRTPDGLQRALDVFTRATDLDPSFARAWAGIAFTYSVLPEYAVFDMAVALRQGREAAERAVRLEPGSAEARTALGAMLDRSGRPAAALGEFDRAIALDPSFATAHHWRAILLLSLGRPEEALEGLRRARTHDPASLPLHIAVAIALEILGRTEEALAECEAALARAPDFRSGLVAAFILAAQLGRAREYEPRLRGYLRSLDEDAAHAAVIVAGIEDAAHRAAAIAVLDAIRGRLTGTQEHDNLAGLYALLGAREQTLRLLEENPRSYVSLDRPFLAFLHDDVRYRALRAQRQPPGETR